MNPNAVGYAGFVYSDLLSSDSRAAVESSRRTLKQKDCSSLPYTAPMSIYLSDTAWLDTLMNKFDASSPFKS